MDGGAPVTGGKGGAVVEVVDVVVGATVLVVVDDVWRVAAPTCPDAGRRAAADADAHPPRASAATASHAAPTRGRRKVPLGSDPVPVRVTTLAAVVVLGVSVGACSTTAPRADRHPRPARTSATALTTSTTTTPSATTTSTPSPVTQAVTPPPTSAVTPAFVGTASPVTAADVPSTWRAGCPVGPADLRMLRMSYWGFDDQPHVGTMVVNAAVVTAVLSVFDTLYGEHFPIRKMQPEDAYGGIDPASMADDNTSGFNCRYAVAPGPPSWSVHAYGEAIDVNPVENPYYEGGAWQPDAGAAFSDRTDVRPGMAVPGGQLIAAFAAVGWQWGGRWAGSPDYQHFSANGN